MGWRVGAIVLVGGLTACSGTRVQGRFLGLETREACVPQEHLAQYSAGRTGQVLHLKCFVDRGAGEPVAVGISLWWDYGEEVPSQVSGSADPSDERRSAFFTEGLDLQYMEHEVEISVLDLDRMRVRGTAQAWSERSDFRFDFAGSIFEVSGAAE